jgi:hypothetical protein
VVAVPLGEHQSAAIEQTLVGQRLARQPAKSIPLRFDLEGVERPANHDHASPFVRARHPKLVDGFACTERVGPDAVPERLTDRPLSFD